jgi:carbon storage regulator
MSLSTASVIPFNLTSLRHARLRIIALANLSGGRILSRQVPSFPGFAGASWNHQEGRRREVGGSLSRLREISLRCKNKGPVHARVRWLPLASCASIAASQLSMEGLPMLILTRRPGESIQVGEDIEISVLEIRGNQVRLGINAPADVLVLRSELLEAKPQADADQPASPVQPRSPQH